MRSALVDDGEEFAHPYTRAKSMYQLVSQLPPLSAEKAYSQRAEFSVMRDHRQRTRIGRPS